MLASAFCFASALVLGLAADIPSSPDCIGECAETFAAGYVYENASWVVKDLSTDPFWDIPADTNATAAGDLIKWENITPNFTQQNWTTPGGMTLARFLYYTEDVDGSLLPASAFALLPYHPPSGQNQFRTIIWTHGTAGFMPKCAPSNHKNLYYEWQAPYSMAMAGYAVIAPDYTGLGTNIPQGFMYLAGYPHAADTVFSLVAARKQLGDILSKEYVVIGQSEGGMVAWRTNERLAMEGQDALFEAGTFLGSVAIAPSMQPFDLIEDFFESQNIADSAGIVLFLLQSLSGLYPDQIRLEDWFTPVALSRAKLSREACVYGAYYLFTGLNITETYTNTSWTRHPAALDWRKTYMREGIHPLSAPLMIVQGGADFLVFPNSTEKAYNQTCDNFPASSVILSEYSGADHDVVTTAAQRDYMAWVADRFDGVSAPVGCSRSNFGPLFDSFNPFATTYKENV